MATASKRLSELDWQPGFTRLGAAFHQRVMPTPLPSPELVAWNPGVASRLGIDQAAPDQAMIELLAGNRVPEGLHPTAAAYAGHQFGVWVPELGDGRAIILGDLAGPDHQPHELQLKGAGLTRWSRMGDGRAVLRSTIREYLASAAMTGLGIPTTEALAIVRGDLPVHREQTEQAAVLTRIAPTHVRFGTFEYLASRRLDDAIRYLVEWLIERHHPELLPLPEQERHAAWLAEVVARTARLMAMWTAAGFAHGVMNTDNFSILGLTLDYGPYGWLDRYDPETICNHTDRTGLYAFINQPSIALWNCVQLAKSLVTLVDTPTAQEIVERFGDIYQTEALDRFRARLGLEKKEAEDAELVGSFLDMLEDNEADFNRSFRALARWRLSEPLELEMEISDSDRLGIWLTHYLDRASREERSTEERQRAMLRTNPRYVLRNWVAQEAITAAEHGELERVDEIRRLLDNPYDEHTGWERYAQAPPEWARDLTVSCSS